MTGQTTIPQRLRALTNGWDEPGDVLRLADEAAARIERLEAALAYVASRRPDEEASHRTAGYSPEKACGLRVTRAREALDGR